uniref:Mitochondrial import receptor subunit TOM70 n=1 Tax=Ditylenchus dipsaci TaxID=166011 RepID=A0A915DN88_9BILA
MSINASTSQGVSGIRGSLQRAISGENSARNLLVGGAAALAVGGVGYYYYKRTHPSGTSDSIAVAECKKKQGNECFRLKDYQGALNNFMWAVDALKSIEYGPTGDADSVAAQKKKTAIDLMSNCYNNMAACYENLGDHSNCIKYCSLAIDLNSKYWKAINRRSRAFAKMQKYREALGESYDFSTRLSFEALDLKDLTEQQLASIYEERERISQLVVKPEIEATIRGIENTYKPIPQYVIANWIWYSVTKDPLVLRAEKLNPKMIYTGVDAALVQLKKTEYDQVLPVALELLKDDSMTNLELVQATLLVCRFLHLHNQTAAAREYTKNFDAAWQSLDEEMKADCTDLHVAYLCLCVSIAENNNQAVTNAEKALAVDPENADPLLTLGLRYMEQEAESDALDAFNKALLVDPAHPYIKFYVLYLKFVDACKNQRINDVHGCIFQFDQALSEVSSPPVFALLLFVKVCVLSNNTELALATAKKAIIAQPNNAYALSLHALVATEPTEKLEICLDRLQRNMDKVVEADPNYWEPYRTLARMSLERAKADEKEKYKVMPFYEKAVTLARRREEFDILLKDKLWAELELERQNKAILNKASASKSVKGTKTTLSGDN